MLHHYNYSTSLSHFLSYHQFDDQASNGPSEQNGPEEESRCKSSSSATSTTTAANKSFTIAAILGLNGDQEKTPATDLSVVNLSVHGAGTDHQHRLLQIPAAGRHGASASVSMSGHHFAVGSGCAPPRHNVRGMKHITSGVISNKKSCKSKRVRTIFTPEQLERLEAEFERQQYMVGPERLYLAHTLQLTEAQVKVWFQNRRIKWRKHHLELTHQRLAVLKQQQIMLDENHPDVQDTNSSSTDT